MPEALLMFIAAAGGAASGIGLDRLAQALPGEPPRLSAAWRQRRRVILALGMGLSCGYLVWRFGVTPRLLVAVWYAALFFLISAIDIEHRLVLNIIMYPAIILAPVTGMLWGLHPVAIAFGGVIEFGLFLLSAVLLRGSVAAGDVKLGAFLGLIAGYPLVIRAMIYTGLLSGVVSVVLLVLRIKSRKDYIPFAPFLVWGTAAALLISI